MAANSRIIRFHLTFGVVLCFGLAAGLLHGEAPVSVQDSSFATAPAFPEVEVLALFPDAAMLLVDGEKVFLKAGESTHAGLSLNWASSQQLELSFWNEIRRFTLSDKVQSKFEAPTRANAIIHRNDQGQFLAGGAINGRAVDFLVDTGANIVVINGNTAGVLGIDLKDAPLMFVDTSAGVSRAYSLVLKSVQVGNIIVHDVAATVIPGEYPANVLLGMSFLQNVEIREQAGTLVLIDPR